jgi:2-methylisocitrate lyase-like PEP mutase family enzyme
MTLEQRRVFRSLLQRSGPIVAPGAYDCLTARLVERAGFEATIVTGAGVAASILGVPDLGLVSMTEALTQTRNIASSVSIPIIADCNTGYGNPINVRRTVREFEAAGAAALFIEDQVSPKRCGHFAGKQVIEADEMAQKLCAAVDVRSDPNLVLIARTDARAVHGPDEAIRRARRYVEAGAEMIFVEAPQSKEELETIARELAPLRVPLMVNLVEGGRTPMVPVSELSAMGFKLITFSGSLQKTAIHAMQELLTALRDTGEVSDFYPGRMVSLEERSEILGLPAFFELERRYATD